MVCVCASSWKGCVPMPDHQNQSARVVRTRRVCRPIVICVPNMHAKDERPDVLVDAGGLLRSVPGDPCVAADSCHKLCV